MKKILLVSAFAALLLSACASHHAAHHRNMGIVDPLNVYLSIADGKQIVVSQEPIYFAKNMKDVTVTWHAPVKFNYTFGANGIVIEKKGNEFVDCKPAVDGRSFSCLNKHTKPGTYKYTVTLDGKPAIAPLDPALVND